MDQIGPSYLPPNLPPDRYYDLMLPLVRGNIEESRAALWSQDRVSAPIQVDAMGTLWLSMNMEAKWYSLGAPEYKVHPGMVEALAHTRLELPGRAVQLPFPCFAVRLPQHYLREAPGAPWIQSILVAEIYEQQLGALRRKLCLLCEFEPSDGAEDPFDSSILSKFELDMAEEGAINVRECVDRMPLGNTDEGYWPSREMTTELVALVISTALIAIGNDKSLIRQGTVSTIERMRREKTIKRHGPNSAGTIRPFEVGSDIKLPRRERNYGSGKNDTAEETGRHLSYAHIRSGHIRLARCKDDSGEIVWRPVFIHPTLVRPDLPMRPKTTPRAVMTPEAANGNG